MQTHCSSHLCPATSPDRSTWQEQTVKLFLPSDLWHLHLEVWNRSKKCEPGTDRKKVHCWGKEAQYEGLPIFPACLTFSPDIILNLSTIHQTITLTHSRVAAPMGFWVVIHAPENARMQLGYISATENHSIVIHDGRMWSIFMGRPHFWSWSGSLKIWAMMCPVVDHHLALKKCHKDMHNDRRCWKPRLPMTLSLENGSSHCTHSDCLWILAFVINYHITTASAYQSSLQTL